MNFALAIPDANLAHALPGIEFGSGTIVHIEIVTRMELAEAAWRLLCSPDNLSTPYQDYDFCALWLRHVGERTGATPFIVVGRDAAGAPLFLWPLVRVRKGPCSVVSYFCGSHANFRTTIWRSDIASTVTARDLRLILRQIKRAGVDAVALLNQPERWNGFDNPLQLLPNQISPDATYGIALDGTGDEIVSRHLNADTRRKFRRKERNLSKLPGFAYKRASSDAEVDRYITAFMEQKGARLAARGIKNAFSEPGVEDFLRAASKHGLAQGRPLIEIHALDSDDEVLALFSGIHDDRCFSTMFNSYTLSEQARWSPGFTLLLKMVESCAKRGFASLNLGMGAAEYKSSLSDIKGLQFDTILGLSAKGHLLSAALRCSFRLKAAVKSNAQLSARFLALRAKLFARSAAL